MPLLELGPRSSFWREEEILRTNQKLLECVAQSKPFTFCESICRLAFAHLGPGLYPPKAGFCWHQHSDCQIEVALKGQFEFTIAESKSVSVTLQPGDALLIFPGVSHKWTTPTGGAMLGANLDRYPLVGMQDVVRRASGKGFAVTRQNATASAAQLLCDAMTLYSRGEIGQLLLASGLGSLIGITLSTAFSSPKNQKVPAKSLPDRHAAQVVENTCRFLRDNLSRKISSQDLAQISGLSYRHLNRVFLQHAHRSVHQYLLEVRLLKAEEMLKQQRQVSVKEVAYSCGFSSPGHLTESMKKYLGVIPSRCR